MKLLTVLLLLWTLSCLPGLFGSAFGAGVFLVSLAVTVACGIAAWPRERGPRQTWPHQ